MCHDSGRAKSRSPEGQVDPVPAEFDGAPADGQMQRDLGVGLLQVGEPWDKPAHGNGGLARKYHGGLLDFGRSQAFNGRGELGEESAQCQVQRFAGRRQPLPAPILFEQLETEIARELRDASADGAVGERQAIPGRTERAQSSRRLESPEIV